MHHSNSFVESFVSVHFEMHHQDCWSNATELSGIKTHTLVCRPLVSENTIFAIIEVKVPTRKLLKNFIREMKNSKKIITIDNIMPINSSRTVYRISFKETYDSMVAKILLEHGSVFQNSSSFYGREFVHCVLPRLEADSLRKDLEDVGSISSFITSDTNINNYLPISLNVSSKELETILTAFKLGYYSFPRKTNLSLISTELCISTSTAHEYLNKAENKIIGKALVNYMDRYQTENKDKVVNL